MPQLPDTIAHCQSCGCAMDVSELPPYSNVACPSCGEHTRVKREFGPYTLVRRHAIGGMSMVFVAHDSTLDREVALKILSEEYSADERRIAAFEEEARITASFSHPHVVRVLRTGKAFGQFFIAMELVPGGHFEHQIRERGKVPESEVLPLAIEVAHGLKAAHAAGLIHRDVKPGNILLDSKGHAKIVDFGLALVTQGGKAQATELWATPYYVPPETIEGMPEDFRSDIYAFGATFYHALAGKPSCGEETMATDLLREAKQRVVPLSAAEPSISTATCAIIEKAMSYDPKDRFGSYDGMIKQLEAAMKLLKTGWTSAAEASSLAQRRAKRKRIELITTGSIALVLMIALSVGIWWMARKNPVKTALVPASLEVLPVIPEDPSHTDIASIYNDARVAVQARDFKRASELFSQLGGSPDVQDPTRSWAGIEAVVAAYMDGNTANGRRLANIVRLHLDSLPKDANHLGARLVGTLGRLSDLPPIIVKPSEVAKPDGPQVMIWMLAGLKNWEQGMLAPAAACFNAASVATLSGDDARLLIYQSIAKDYLTDYQALTSPAFETFPADRNACLAAVDALNGVLGSMKTKGRARFNVRAWQLDLTRHAMIIETGPNQQVADVVVPKVPDLSTVMARLSTYGSDCAFTEAAVYLKSLPSAPPGTSKESLLSVVESAAIFLVGMEEDLAKDSLVLDLVMKSGEVMRKIELGPDGKILTTDASGKATSHTWADFEPDSLISLHRILVKNPRDDLERLRRHQCAISFDWLAGNRERGLSAAVQLSQASAGFKQQWEEIAAGLPK